jgi:hypothetical protein
MNSSGLSRPHSPFAAFILALIGISASMPVALAQTAPSANVYTVEIIVFRNMTGAGGPEDWTAKPIPRGPDQPDSPVTGRFVGAVPAAQYQLKDVAAKLRSSTNYPLVAHFAWQQTASSWGSRAGFTVNKLAGNVPGLSGIFFLEAGTYLHLGMTLNYQSSDLPAGLAASPGTVFTLAESRRVKPYERNYYDHPGFGVIALVTRANRATGGR